MVTLLHPDRYNPCYPNQIRKLGVVIHTSESDDATHDVLVRLLQGPGDRLNPDGSKYGAGYHAVTKGGPNMIGSYTRMADPDAGPFSAPPFNYTWAHVCIPGRAAQTRDQWLDEYSRDHIHGAALFVVDQWIMDGKSYPLDFRTVVGLQQFLGGYTSHNNVSYAFHKSTHTDPGPNFPWDVLAADIAALSTPGDDDMPKNVYYSNLETRTFEGVSYPPKNIKYRLNDNGEALRVDGEEIGDREGIDPLTVGLGFGTPKSNDRLNQMKAPL